MSITVQQLAEYILGRPARTGKDFDKAGLAMIGGCAICHATLAATNAYPSRLGFWLCLCCIGTQGWNDVVQAQHEMFGAAHIAPTRKGY